MTHTPKLQFADLREQKDLPIEILVEDDHYWKIVKDSPPLRISTSVVLLPLKLGWVLSGNRSGISTNFIYRALVRYQRERSGGSGIWKLSASYPTRTKGGIPRIQLFSRSFTTLLGQTTAGESSPYLRKTLLLQPTDKTRTGLGRWKQG
jgi:hypothetical protein